MAPSFPDRGVGKYVNSSSFQNATTKPSDMSFLNPLATPSGGLGLGAGGTPLIFTPSTGAASGPTDFISSPSPAAFVPDSTVSDATVGAGAPPPQLAAPGGPFMYNPSAFSGPPMAVPSTGRPGMRR